MKEVVLKPMVLCYHSWYLPVYHLFQLVDSIYSSHLLPRPEAHQPMPAISSSALSSKYSHTAPYCPNRQLVLYNDSLSKWNNITMTISVRRAEVMQLRLGVGLPTW